MYPAGYGGIPVLHREQHGKKSEVVPAVVCLEAVFLYLDPKGQAGRSVELQHLFDFKGAYGNLSLASELKDHLFESIRGWSGFLRNMTENALYFKPPIGLFGKLRVESEGKHKNAFDIKYAMLPITDVTRVYALKNNVRQTNTLSRLFRLYTRHAITAGNTTTSFSLTIF